MYAPAIRTEPRLAEQNTQPSWADCTLRRRPRPHRFGAAFSVSRTDKGTRWYHRCGRCPVMTMTEPGIVPDPWLGRRPS